MFRGRLESKSSGVGGGLEMVSRGVDGDHRVRREFMVHLHRRIRIGIQRHMPQAIHDFLGTVGMIKLHVLGEPAQKREWVTTEHPYNGVLPRNPE
jgi:hypothetical protein